MGMRNKGLLKIHRRAMVEHIIARLKRQLGTIFINANHDIERYQRYGREVISDTLDGFQGPLAGMLVASERCRTRWLCAVPCDSPLVAKDLVIRLHQCMTDEAADLALASDGKRLHPVFCLMRADLHDHIRRVLDSGERKIESLFVGIKTATADFSDQPECFLNVNRPEDLSAMKDLLPEN